MRNTFLALFVAMTIISGCRSNSGIRAYWSERTPNIDDIAAAEDEFTNFAELAVDAPEADAFWAVDQLLRKASKDEVTFIVYTDWIARGFGLVASPCYSPSIFTHAAKTALRKRILDSYLTAEYKKRLEFCSHNRVGDKAKLAVDLPIEGRTLILVVDQDCPSCRKAMERLAKEWEGLGLVALCVGHGALPGDPDWKCLRLPNDQNIFDAGQSPFYFVIGADGIVEQAYKSAYDYEN